MLLVLGGECAYRHVREKIDEILVVRRIEHLIRRKEPRLLYYAQVHVTNGLHALEHVVGGLGVGVVEQSLVPGTLGPRLVGIDAWHKHEPIRDALLQGCKTRGILEHRILAVG